MFWLHRVRIATAHFPVLVLRICEKLDAGKNSLSACPVLSANLPARLTLCCRRCAARAVTRDTEAVVAQTSAYENITPDRLIVANA
jgi:hypothetical protein